VIVEGLADAKETCVKCKRQCLVACCYGTVVTFFVQLVKPEAIFVQTDQTGFHLNVVNDHNLVGICRAT